MFQTNKFGYFVIFKYKLKNDDGGMNSIHDLSVTVRTN